MEEEIKKHKHKWIKLKYKGLLETNLRDFYECENCDKIRRKYYKDDPRYDPKLVVNYTPNK